MKLFVREVDETGRAILRFTSISAIESNTLRRALLLLGLPILIVLSWLLLAWPLLWRLPLLPFAFGWQCLQSAREVFKSMLARWDEPYRDDN